MSRGIGVPFVADVGPFLKGTGQIEDALGNVSDALDDVAREGQRTEDVVSRSMTDIGTEGKQSADKLEGQFKEAFDSITTNAKTAAAKAERHIDAIPDDTRKHSKSKFGDLGTELGGEFSQNIGDGISSGKVGVAGALDTMLGTLGGVLPALGPAGAMIGVGALVVGSIVQGILNNQDEVRKAVQKTMSDAIDAAADVLDNGKKARTIGEIIKGFTPEEKQSIDDAGLSLYDFAAALKTYEDTGDKTTLDKYSSAIDTRKKALDGLTGASNNLFGSQAPNVFEVGGPLVTDPAIAGLIAKTTGDIDQRAAALTKLQAQAARVDLDKLKAIRQELGKPINQSNSSLLRFLTS